MLYSPIQKWDGRKKKHFDGYTLVWVPEHPRSFKGWYYEHRLVMEKDIRRLLEKWETVHHINEIKTDNRLCNLFVCSEDEHKKAHV